MEHRRHGDVNLHPITKEQFEKFQGKIKKHNGSYVIAEGEATGSTHDITVENPLDMIVKEDGETRMIALIKSAKISHTHDHETITTPETPTYYIQVPEREVDNFQKVTRQVID